MLVDPSAWKLATVTGIFKNKGNKHDPSNYRPISLTSIACRILESISIMGYLKTNSILSDKQFGFLGGRSTILQLLIAMDEWTEILDRGGAIDVIYCDFQKAFDTVAHNRLMDVLCHYNKGSNNKGSNSVMDRRLFEEPETASFSKWIQVKPLRCFFRSPTRIGLRATFIHHLH